MNDLISVESLTRVFDSPRPAVEALTFSIRRGEIFSLLGPNGAGKTTTLRMLAGLIRPSYGRIEFDGVSLDEPESLEAVHGRIGVLPEVPGLYESLTVRRNLEFFGRLQGLASAEVHARSQELLRSLDMWEHRDERVATFSKGMKQKVAIVRALLHDPDCLILDEPVSGLDPEAAKSLRDYFLGLRRQGKTIVLSTHNLDDADRLSDRVAVLRARLLAVDPPEELKRRLFRSKVSIQFPRVTQGVVEFLGRQPSVLGIEQQGNKVELDLAHPDQELPGLIEALVGHGEQLQYVEPVGHSLEEVYLKLVEGRDSPAAPVVGLRSEGDA